MLPTVVVALDLLPHLAKCAKERKTITYAELGTLVGKSAYYLSKSLDILKDKFLLAHRLPRLDALIIKNPTKGAADRFLDPGSDPMTAEEYEKHVESLRQEVYAYDRWDEIVEKLQAHYGDSEYMKHAVALKQ